MDFGQMYHFFFETYVGIGVMIAAALVISVLICVFWEFRTRKVYRDRGPRQNDEWALFDDEEDENDEDE